MLGLWRTHTCNDELVYDKFGGSQVRDVEVVQSQLSNIVKTSQAFLKGGKGSEHSFIREHSQSISGILDSIFTPEKYLKKIKNKRIKSKAKSFGRKWNLLLRPW